MIAIHGDKVLVLKKVGEPLRYALPGGARKGKETPVETLVREVGEEIGLELAETQVGFLFSHTKKKKKKKNRPPKHYFLIEMEPLPIQVREKDKFEVVLWLPWKEALPFMDSMDRKAVRTHFKATEKKTNNKNGHKIPPRLAM